ncbi:hypothetical protein ACW7BJ_16275 [Azospirillum argentinense]
MRDIPIIFSAPMVRALLAGRKTQTRRILKPQPPKPEDFPGSVFGLSRAVADDVNMFSLNDYDRLPKHPTKWDLVGSVGVARAAGFPMEYNARYAVGDRLWVRENWAETWEKRPWYRATPEAGLHPVKPIPSIHMPRWASRLTLVVEGVKVERLQDISEADAIAEGAEPCANGYWFDRTASLAGSDARGAFYCLWSHLHGADAWATNPVVGAITFAVHRCNIAALDQTKGGA